MDTSKLADHERRIRSAVRAFLMLATLDELHREKQISLDAGDRFRAACVQELIDES